jgi:hypothetical protein
MMAQTARIARLSEIPCRTLDTRAKPKVGEINIEQSDLTTTLIFRGCDIRTVGKWQSLNIAALGDMRSTICL